MTPRNFGNPAMTDDEIKASVERLRAKGWTDDELVNWERSLRTDYDAYDREVAEFEYRAGISADERNARERWT